MKARTALAAALFLLGVSTSVGVAQEPTFRELLEQTLPGMGAEQIADRKDAQQRLQDVCFKLGAPGREAERAEACTLMAAKLGPQTPKPARIWLLKQLEFIGRAECVDAVAALLDDQDQHVRDAARRALQNNPAPTANAKLLGKLRAGGNSSWRVALVNSLGFRGEQASVGPLARLLADKDEALAAAAANALGRIGGEQAARALDAAKATGDLRMRIADAYLRCADRFLDEGEKDRALAIYAELAQRDVPDVIRMAALQGQLNAAGPRAVSMIMDWLRGNDAEARTVAAGHMAQVIAQARLPDLAEDFPHLPASGKALLLSALAAAGNKAAMPVALSAAESQEERVRLAGLRALAELGDASVVPLLVETMAGGGSAGGAARESLQQVYGQGVDEAIIEAMRRAETGMRGALIDVLSARVAVTAAPVLFEEAKRGDSDIRNRAIRALGNLAEPKHVPAMISLLLSQEEPGERQEAERAIIRICSRTLEPENRADPVLAALARANEEHRCVLLPLLGRIGSEKALAAVQDALGSGNAAIRDASVSALCNWPDPSVTDQLLALAQGADQERHRIRALRAYIRLAGSSPEQQRLDLLSKAMELATRDDERKLVLRRAASVRRIEALRWVVPYLDDPSLATEASRAVVELARHRNLMAGNRPEFLAALKKVIEICQDAGLVSRAKAHAEQP